MSVQCRLPTQEMVDRSEQRQMDCFYKLPREIECFVDRANNEIPDGYMVVPWTINRAVTLFRGTEAIQVLTYENIEAHMVCMLDLVGEMVREDQVIN